MTPSRPTYFASDFHLGAACVGDRRAHERRVVDWLEKVVAPDAGSLYLLGDVIDYWWEYRTVVPRGFVRFFGALARIADAGIEITWMRGNHDIWLRDYLSSEIGLRVVDGPMVETIGGRRFLLDHGDGVGRRPPGFRMLRSLFRNPLAQAAYGAVHPRWTIGMAHAWSAHSRKQELAAPTSDVILPLKDFAESYPRAEADFFVFGHVHRPAVVPLSGNRTMVVLGDWLHRSSYAVYRDGIIGLKEI